jgi:hypothetical protein
MSRDHHDLLMDQMLRELLGGDRPRDITDRVLARVRTYDKVRRHWWTGVGSAIAASIAIGVTLWALWPRSGDYQIATLRDGFVDISNTETLQRGSRIVTPEENSATIALGGYVNVEMAPKTVMTLGGARFAEKVFLEQGELDVHVIPGRGTFDVGAGRAVVHVTGTKFQVGFSEEESDDRRTKKLRVAVKEGSVKVEVGAAPPVTLAAGTPLTEKVFDLSPEPTRVERIAAAPIPDGIRPGARIGAQRGAAFGTGEGGRPGLIGPNFITSTSPRPQFPTLAPAPPAAAPGPNRGGPAAAGRGNLFPAPNAGGVIRAPGRNMQVVIGPGEVEFTGILRREGERGVFFLEVENAPPILLFAQQNPPPPPRAYIANLGKRMKVKWVGGEFREMLPAEAPAQSGSF